MNSVRLAPAVFDFAHLYWMKHRTVKQSVTAKTNKTAATVVKPLEHLLGSRHTVWMDSFYNSPELVKFMKSKRTDCAVTSRARTMFLL
jgi:hypothetical protein